MSVQYLEATYRPNINIFTGEYAEAVKYWQGNRVEEAVFQNNDVKKLLWLFFLR